MSGKMPFINKIKICKPRVEPQSIYWENQSEFYLRWAYYIHSPLWIFKSDLHKLKFSTELIKKKINSANWSWFCIWSQSCDIVKFESIFDLDLLKHSHILNFFFFRLKTFYGTIIFFLFGSDFIWEQSVFVLFALLLWFFLNIVTSQFVLFLYPTYHRPIGLKFFIYRVI